MVFKVPEVARFDVVLPTDFSRLSPSFIKAHPNYCSWTFATAKSKMLHMRNSDKAIIQSYRLNRIPVEYFGTAKTADIFQKLIPNESLK